MIDIIARGMIEESNGDISQISEKVNNHTEDSDIHVTVTDKENWNSHPNDVMASGNPVQIDGLQGGVPFSEITVSGKNLIPFPYYDGNSKTHNGITFTVNSDGSVTANGTATATAIFYISTDFTIKKGIYTLSGCPKSDSNTNYILQFATGDWSFKVSDFGNGATTQIDNDINLQIFRIAISNGVVCDNLVFRPQLELGTTATAYEPPITGRDLTVGVSGKNLIPTDYMSRSGTYNGVTFSVNDNGKFDISGTATKGFALVSFIKNMSLVGGKKYTFSCNKQYDINTFNCAAKILTKGGIWKHSVTSYPSTIIASDGDYIGSFGIWANEGVEISAENVEIQLEIGDTATEYETPVGSKITITPTSNPYVIPNDIRQADGLNNISVSEGELSVTGVRKNAAVKKIWDKIDELTTAIIVSNGETIE